jgi:tetratricopeptide (TPR) repeat protein
MKTRIHHDIPKKRAKRRWPFYGLPFALKLVAVSFLIPNIAATPQDSSAVRARIEGRVSTIAGQPISAAVVHFLRAGTATAVEVRTDSDGKYVAALPAGSFNVRAAKDGFQPRDVPSIELKPGQTTHLDLVLEKAGTTGVTSGTGTVGRSMEFSDEPNFAVAGVTDWSNVGLHGSDAIVRTSESLAKETAALRPPPDGSRPGTAGAGDAHRVLGDAREKSDDPVAAVNEYKEAVRLDPSEENYFAWGAELLLHRAGVPAVEVFKNGVAAHPKSSRMLAGLGAAYYADGQYTEAAQWVCKASDLNPADAHPYLLLGKMETSSTDLSPCSEEKLRRFADEQPGNALADYYYGLVLWKNARRSQNKVEFSAAEQLFKKATALDPKLGEAYLQLGLLFNAREEKTAAIAAFQKAIAASPDLSAPHYQLSLEYRQSGEPAKAEEEMRAYEKIKRFEDVELEKQRRELRQFVTILKRGQGSSPPQ